MFIVEICCNQVQITRFLSNTLKTKNIAVKTILDNNELEYLLVLNSELKKNLLIAGINLQIFKPVQHCRNFLT